MTGNQVSVVAELSANHGGRLETAMETLRVFKEAGADAVKLQTYDADSLTIDCREEPFVINQGTLWDGRTLYDLYREAAMPKEWHKPLFDLGRQLELTVFSTPFSIADADFLKSFNPPAYKIASFEIADVKLIEHAAAFGKPMIISTGIATLDEIQAAVDTCRRCGVDDITLLQCCSEYPADPAQANLRMIPSLAETFGVKSGLSDHSLGPETAAAAVALGAVLIEKHVILDRSIGGPDAAFSMEPDRFAEMVRMIRSVEQALGRVDYSMTERKRNSRRFARSLFVVKDVRKGDPVTEDNVRSIRPGLGLPPAEFTSLAGRVFRRDLVRGTPLAWNLLE